jgi:hypothetical protein
LFDLEHRMRRLEDAYMRQTGRAEEREEARADKEEDKEEHRQWWYWIIPVAVSIPAAVVSVLALTGTLHA